MHRFTISHLARTIIAVFLLSLLTILAVRLRLLGFQRLLWLDEATHNTFILSSHSFLDLRTRLAPLLQPIFEFVTRKYFWFPLFGHEEWGLRLPSLVMSSLTVLLSAAMGFNIAGGRKFFWSSLSIGLFVGAWCATHPTEIYYGAEARHYALVACLSVLWTWTYLKLNYSHMQSIVALLGVSAFFANTHFFALPLVILACSAESLYAFFQRNTRSAVTLILGIIAVSLATITLNRPAWDEMLHSPAVQSAQAISYLNAAQRAATDWFNCLKYFFPSDFVLIFLTALLLILIKLRLSQKGKVQAMRLALIIFIAIPALFLRMRLTSDYPFYARYYSPFFGLGAGVLALISSESTVQVRKYFSQLAPFPGFAASFIILGLTLPTLSQPVIPLPPKENFTTRFQEFENIKSKNEPIFVIASPCWNSEVPKLYLEYIGASLRQEVEYADQFKYRDCVLTLKNTKGPLVSQLQKFLSRHDSAQIILYDQYGSCDSTEAGCIHVLSEQRSVSEIIHHAESIGFPRVSKDLKNLLERAFTD